VDRVRENLVPQIPHFFTRDLHERCRILSYHFRRAGILIDGSLPLFCTALMRRTVATVGPLDESLGGSEDDDYCCRLRDAGYVLGLSLDTYILHHSGASNAGAPRSIRGRRSRTA
jgi:GT2 family glycosyltransferase